MEPKKDFITANGSKFYYEMQGAGDPLVMLHGGFSDLRVWDFQFSFFSGDYTVLRYDQRGFGKSDSPQKKFSYITDLEEIRRGMEFDAPILMGSSFGGEVAIDYTLENPQQVKALILVGAALNGFAYPDQFMDECLKIYSLWESRGREHALDALMSDGYWDYFFPSSDKLPARNKFAGIVKENLKVFSWDQGLYDRTAPPSVERLHQIQVPVLIVCANGDSHFNQAAAAFLAKEVKGAKMVVMKGCGHLPYLEEPEKFNGIVQAFLEELDRTREIPE